MLLIEVSVLDAVRFQNTRFASGTVVLFRQMDSVGAESYRMRPSPEEGADSITKTRNSQMIGYAFQ